MKNKGNTIHNKVVIMPNEYHNINCLITDADFGMNHPNPCRVNRTAFEIDEYLARKRKHMEVRI